MASVKREMEGVPVPTWKVSPLQYGNDSNKGGWRAAKKTWKSASSSGSGSVHSSPKSEPRSERKHVPHPAPKNKVTKPEEKSRTGNANSNFSKWSKNSSPTPKHAARSYGGSSQKTAKSSTGKVKQPAWMAKNNDTKKQPASPKKTTSKFGNNAKKQAHSTPKYGVKAENKKTSNNIVKNSPFKKKATKSTARNDGINKIGSMNKDLTFASNNKNKRQETKQPKKSVGRVENWKNAVEKSKSPPKRKTASRISFRRGTGATTKEKMSAFRQKSQDHVDWKAIDAEKSVKSTSAKSHQGFGSSKAKSVKKKSVKPVNQKRDKNNRGRAGKKRTTAKTAPPAEDEAAVEQLAADVKRGRGARSKKMRQSFQRMTGKVSKGWNPVSKKSEKKAEPKTRKRLNTDMRMFAQHLNATLSNTGNDKKPEKEEVQVGKLAGGAEHLKGQNAANDVLIEKYSKMYKMGIPEGAIRQTMMKDGFTQADTFFAES